MKRIDVDTTESKELLKIVSGRLEESINNQKENKLNTFAQKALINVKNAIRMLDYCETERNLKELRRMERR